MLLSTFINSIFLVVTKIYDDYHTFDNFIILWILYWNYIKHLPKLITLFFFPFWAYSIRPRLNICFCFCFSWLKYQPAIGIFRRVQSDSLISFTFLAKLSSPHRSRKKMLARLAANRLLEIRQLFRQVNFCPLHFLAFSSLVFLSSNRIAWFHFRLSLPIFTVAIIVAILLHCSQLRELLSSQSFHSSNPNNFFIYSNLIIQFLFG